MWKTLLPKLWWLLMELDLIRATWQMRKSLPTWLLWLSHIQRDASFNESKIIALKCEIDRLKKDKESNQIKIDNFENASKSLDKLIGSQISDNNKKGVGYNAVPPPPTGLFAPLTIDLSNSSLEEFQKPEFEGYGFKDNKSVCENSSNEIKKTTDALIIKDWVFDCDEDDYEVMGTGQREVRPVWNNAMRVNHQNFSNSRRNFVPTAVLTKSGIVPVSAARPINTAAPKSFVNSVNTAKGNKVTSVVREQGINVVKSSACWVWRPKIKADLSLELKVLVVHHTTNGHQFTMSNRQERIGYSKANDNCMEFCDKHNMVAFLQKPTGSEEFHQIVDFLVDSHIRYALTTNPTIYILLIEQVWQTATVETLNDREQQITVTVDRKTYAITEAFVRRHLQLADVDGISSLPNTKIFEQLTLMGYVSTDDKLTF
ncbi:hypothetical protein Tco_1530852 [Tanacetum coccineum]